MSAEGSTGALVPVEKSLNRFMRAITGGIRSTPIPLLHAESGIPNLQTLIDDASGRYYIRMSMSPGTPLDRTFERWDAKEDASSPMTGMKKFEGELLGLHTTTALSGVAYIDDSLHKSISDIQFHILNNREEAKEALEERTLIKHDGLNLYTDGAFRPQSDKHPRATAGGWVLFDGRREILRNFTNITPPFSSYSAEICALIRALDDLVELFYSRVTGRDIHIYTDSQGLLRHLQSLITTGKRVNSQSQDLAIRLNNVIQLNPRSITMVWVPGHCGIRGNEIADQLSQLGYDDDYAVFTTYTPPSIQRTWCKSRKYDDFGIYLNKNVVESQSSIVPKRDRFKLVPSKKKEKTMYERSTNMTIFRIRSGHTLTNSHFNRFDKTKSSECRYCHIHSKKARGVAEAAVGGQC